MPRWLAKIVNKVLSRKMCKCQSPYFIARAGLLQCKNCNKPVKWEKGEE